MEIFHEIKSFNPRTGSLAVRYYSNEVPDGLTYNIDIPLVDGAFASESEIEALIQAVKPVGQLERIVALTSAQVPAALAALIPEEPAVVEANANPPIIEGADTPPAA